MIIEMTESTENFPIRKAILPDGLTRVDANPRVPNRVLAGGEEKYNIAFGLKNDAMTDLVFGTDVNEKPEITKDGVVAGLEDYKEAIGIRIQRLNDRKPGPLDLGEKEVIDNTRHSYQELEETIGDVVGLMLHGRRHSSPLQEQTDRIIDRKVGQVIGSIRADFNNVLDERLHDTHGLFPRLREGGRKMQADYEQRFREVANVIEESTQRPSSEPSRE